MATTQIQEFEKNTIKFCVKAKEDASTLCEDPTRYMNEYFLSPLYKERSYIDDTPIVIISAGQSNALGRTALLGTENTYNRKNELLRFGNYISSLTDYKLLDQTVPSNDRVGYAPACADELLKNYSSKLFYVINVAIGSANITSGFVNKNGTWASIGTLRDRAKRIIDGILITLPKYKILGTLWLQGESDVSYASQGQTQLEDFRFSARDIMRWFLDSYGGKFFVSTVAYWDYGQQYNYDEMDAKVDLVNNEYKRATEEIEGAYMATSINRTFGHDYSDSFDGSNVHYSRAEYEIIGRDFARFVLPFMLDL